MKLALLYSPLRRQKNVNELVEEAIVDESKIFTTKGGM